jgi:hypothetical protein
MPSIPDRPDGGNGRRESARSLVRREIDRITNEWAEADRLTRQAPNFADRETAEERRRELAGAFWSLQEQLADLHLLLLRYCLQHRPDALKMYLLDVLQPALLDLLRPALVELVRQTLKDDLPDAVGVLLRRREGGAA